MIAPGNGIDPGTKARLIAPLSSETVDNPFPKLTWMLPSGADGGRVELCQTRACSTVAQTFDLTGTSGTPPSTLTPGLWFWRVHAKTGTTVDPNPSATWEFFVPMGGDSQQFSYGAVPDLDGDGFADVIVGARGADAGNGRVYVYFADGSGGFKSPVTLTRPACEDGQLGTGLGASVATAGDVNGDGYPELVAGAPGGSGGALVWMGGPTGLASPPIQLTRTGSTPAGFGTSVTSVGNVSAYGYAAVAVGTDDPSGTSPGAVYFYPGSATGLGSTPYQTLEGPAPEDLRFGAALASGDFNGDGHGDLLVGAPNTSATKAGHVYIYMGGANGIGTVPLPTVTLTAPVVGGSLRRLRVCRRQLRPRPVHGLRRRRPGRERRQGARLRLQRQPLQQLHREPDREHRRPGRRHRLRQRRVRRRRREPRRLLRPRRRPRAAATRSSTSTTARFPPPRCPPSARPSPPAPATGSSPSPVNAGDFDGDGHADMVVLGSLPGGACGASSQGAARVFRGGSLGAAPVLLQTSSGGDCFGGAVAARPRVLRRFLGGWRG